MGGIAAFCVAALLIIKYTPALKNIYISHFGISSKGMKKGVSFRNPVSSDAPITISHNPNVLIQQRLEQLKDLQKQASIREVNQTTESQGQTDRTKKLFMPVQTGESV